MKNKKTEKELKVLFILLMLLAVILFIVWAVNSSLVNEGEELEKPINCDFIRTYTIQQVLLSNDDKYLYVTIRAFQDEDVQTIKIEKRLSPEIATGKSYEFTFHTTKEVDENSILSIYNNSEIVSIEETEKVGLEQVNTSCKSWK